MKELELRIALSTTGSSRIAGFSNYNVSLFSASCKIYFGKKKKRIRWFGFQNKQINCCMIIALGRLRIIGSSHVMRRLHKAYLIPRNTRNHSLPIPYAKWEKFWWGPQTLLRQPPSNSYGKVRWNLEQFKIKASLQMQPASGCFPSWQNLWVLKCSIKTRFSPIVHF